MAKFTKIKLQKLLANMEREELIAEICGLYDRVPQVREYFAMEDGGGAAVLATYKKSLEKKFKFGTKMRAPKPIDVRTVINAYKALNPPPHELADLLLCRVEWSIRSVIDLQESYGKGLNTSFYNSLDTAIVEIFKFVTSEKLETYFEQRCIAVCVDAQKCWYLTEYFSEYFSTYNEYFSNKFTVKRNGHKLIIGMPNI